MAKNFVQEGKTIAVSNSGTKAILSGAVVIVGRVVAVAITDIQPDSVGDGFTEGVFQFEKLSSAAISAGASVWVKDGVVQGDSADAVYAGVAWEDAVSGSTVINVKINTGAAAAAETSGG